MKTDIVKDVAVTGVCAALGGMFGGLDTLFWALLTCSIIDYFTGMVVAVVFKNSPKTETGGAQSKAGFKGLVKKVFIYALIIVVVKIDIVVGANGFLRNAVIIGFMVNEVLSIIENAGLMGIKIPAALTNAVDILKQKSEEKGDK